MYNFKFADIGEGIHEGQILKWLFKVGDEVKDGDTLCIVETDKVNAEIPSPVNGKIVEIMANVGETIHVGEVLVKIDDGSGTEAETTSDVPMMSDNTNESVSENDGESAGVIGEIEVSNEVIESSNERSTVKGKSSEKVLATPVARKLAKDLGVDINTITGSGTNGRVMKEDIYQAKENKINKPVLRSQVERPQVDVPEIKVTGEVERIPFTRMRKTIAKTMVTSKAIIPHAATMDDYDVTELVKFRKAQKELAAQYGVKLTYLPFVVKAITLALKDYPQFNSSYDQDREELIIKKYINIGIAVDTEEGLIVPVIKNADKLSIFEIAKEVDLIATAARERTLKLDQLQDGTFSITNYGALGQGYGVPIIKHPEVAIFGVGRIKQTPVVLDNEIVIRDIMAASLSFDHRVIDGGDAGRFLSRVKQYLNDPMMLLLK